MSGWERMFWLAKANRRMTFYWLQNNSFVLVTTSLQDFLGMSFVKPSCHRETNFQQDQELSQILKFW